MAPVKEVPFPTRGTPAGWRDAWDDPDDCAEIRARAEEAERWLEERARALGVIWATDIRRETSHQSRRVAQAVLR